MTRIQPQPWLYNLTIGQALDRTVERFADREAVVFPRLGLRWSYAQFGQQVDQAARGLLAMGIRPGEHVAIWATNLPEWVVLQFATARIGAVLVTINPAYRAHELKYVLKQSDAAALVLTDRFKSSNYLEMLAEVCPEFRGARLYLDRTAIDSGGDKGWIHSADLPKLRAVIAIKGDTPAGAISWQRMLETGNTVPLTALNEVSKTLQPTDAINLEYTSGTTGFPKAAMLSHRNLLLNVFYGGQCQGMTDRDRICIPVPFYHCFGCVLGTLMAAVHGATMVVPAESFESAATLDAVEKERCTSLYGVPTMFIAQLNDPSLSGRDLRTLRTGIMAGSPCPIEVMRAVVEKLGCREITIGYGQTEASPIITQTRFDDPIEKRVETVGRPIAGVEVKIVDPATHAELPESVQGELCARGHCVMLRYYNDPIATAEAIDSDGWLHSGDLAVCLSDGYYKITGRIKDMVIRGGENIYPREIEEFLFTHPAIEQASVVGLPDPKYGEELCAWIKLKPGYNPEVGKDSVGAAKNDDSHKITADDIRCFCRGKLAHYKVPRYVKFVTEFPQTVTGKIQKFKIREQMCQALGIREHETA
ncbi:MAG TPA: AMP-binding protein [Pirellulales bacterium]